MSEAKLDQIVKGAPPKHINVPDLADTISRSSTPGGTDEADSKSQSGAADPLSSLPSSPPQIYLNLLILEASLRSQYLHLRARRRTNTFFLILLALWNIYFTFLLFFRPREDGSGIGGSVYWVVETTEKVALMGGLLTGVLVWGTGQWERGIRWPRRWVSVANRGLRGFNLKMVVVKGPWWAELLGHLSFIFPYSSFSPSPGSSFHFIDQGLKKEKPNAKSEKYVYREGHRYPRGMTQEDIAPGGDHVKVLLLPKSFTPEFRENWDLYRTEYWEKENERRAELREVVKKQKRDIAKQKGGRLWRFGWGSWRADPQKSGKDLEKHHHSLSQHRLPPHLRRRRPSTAQSDRNSTHSRSSSRSSTHTLNVDVDEKTLTDRTGRGGRRLRNYSNTSSAKPTIKRMTPSNSRPTTPTYDGDQSSDKRASTLSLGGSSADESESSKGRAGEDELKALTSTEPSPRAENVPNVTTRQRDLALTAEGND